MHRQYRQKHTHTDSHTATDSAAHVDYYLLTTGHNDNDSKSTNDTI